MNPACGRNTGIPSAASTASRTQTSKRAVNLEVKDGKATVGFCSTQERPSATVTLKLKDQVLLNEKIAIGPGHPYVKEVNLPSGADEHDLRASMQADGKECVAYSPVRLETEKIPSPVVDPPPPAAIRTNEELYLTGLRMEQFHSPGGDPNAYWQEALRRDPGDITGKHRAGHRRHQGRPLCRCGKVLAQGARALHRELHIA